MRQTPVLTLLMTCFIAFAGTTEDRVRYPAHVRTEQQKKAWRIGWPQLHGPSSNGRAIDCGYPLVDAFSKARKVWTSEAHTVPASKHTFHQIRGGYASPILAAGRVYFFHVWPHGYPMEKLREMGEDEIRQLTRSWRKSSRKVGTRVDVKTDEFVTCVDALTGKTLWRRHWELRGKLMLGSGKGGGHYTMAVHDGKAYAFGSGGWIYCLDAETGKTIWEHNRHPEIHSPNCTPMIAEGTLVFRDGFTLFGYDAQTGEARWRVKGALKGVRSSACTRVWNVDGRQYFVHEGLCIDPRTGEKLWDVEVKNNAGNNTAISGEYMVCSGASRKDQGPRCFRITPSGAEFLWEIDGSRLITKGFSSHCFNKGHVFMDLGSPNKIPGKDTRVWRFLMVELATGKKQEIPGHYKGWKYQPIIAEGQYIYFAGYNCLMIKADPNDFRELSVEEVNGFARDCSPAYACGLMIVRETERLACYDLRVPGAPVRPIEPAAEPQAETELFPTIEPSKTKSSEATDAARDDFQVRLLKLAEEAVDGGERVSFRLTSMRRTVRLEQVNGRKLVLWSSGLQMPFDMDRLSEAEKSALSVALADSLRTPDAAAVAAFYLTVVGDETEAAGYLDRAGDTADEVADAFQ